MFEDLYNWSDEETGVTFSLEEVVEDGNVQTATGIVYIDGVQVGDLGFKFYEEENTLAISSLCLGPAAYQGVASRYYVYAFGVVTEKHGIKHGVSDAYYGADTLLRNNGWIDNTENDLGKLIYHYE